MPKLMQPAPPYHDHFHTLAAEANDALRRRYMSFPGLIKQGKLTEAAADDELIAWQAIQCDWAAAIGTPRRYRFTAPPEAKLAALKISLDRCNKALEKERQALPVEIRRLTIDGANLLELEDQFGDAFADFLAAVRRRDLVKAMLWWQQHHNGPVASDAGSPLEANPCGR